MKTVTTLELLFVLFVLAGLTSRASAGITLSAFGWHSPDGSQGWNTRSGDIAFDAFDAFIFDETGSLLNQAGTNELSVTLEPGLHTLRFATDSGSFGSLQWPFGVLSLTFNASQAQTPPQISAATTSTLVQGQHPTFTAWSGTTYTNAVTPAIGTGQLTWTDSATGTTVSLIGYWAAPMGVYPSDLVSPQSPVPNGQADYVGEFQLLVVPSPSAAGALCFGLLTLRRRRR